MVDSCASIATDALEEVGRGFSRSKFGDDGELPSATSDVSVVGTIMRLSIASCACSGGASSEFISAVYPLQHEVLRWLMRAVPIPLRRS